MSDRQSTPDVARVIFRRPRPWGSAIIIALIPLALLIRTLATHQPSPQPQIAIACAIVLWIFVVLAMARKSPELLGTTVVMRALFWTRRIDLTTAQSIAVNRAWNGGCYLLIRPRRGYRAYLLLAIWNDLARRGLTADELDTLADVLDGIPGNNVAGDTRRRLTQQAEHLRNGGSLQDSPLRAR